jgi:hypothetical protein
MLLFFNWSFAGYLMGVPVTSYSLGIGQEHVEFAEAKIQARIITRDLTDAEIDGLAVVAVAGGALNACSCSKLAVMWLCIFSTIVVNVVRIQLQVIVFCAAKHTC